MRINRLLLLLVVFAASEALYAQQGEEMTTSCTFADGKQISVRYWQTESKQTKVFGEVVPYGEEWKPGGEPILLFTEAHLALNDVSIPVGAYELYPVPEEERWKLIIKRPSRARSPVSEGQEIGGATLDVGKLAQPLSRFTIYFGKVGEHQCNMRMYWGHTGVWAELKEQ